MRSDVLAAAIPSHMCGQLRHESVIDVLLHQIRAQGRVVKQEPAHDHAAKIEVDMFKHRSRQALLEICTRSEEWTRNSAVSPEDAQAVSGKADAS